MYHRIIDNFLPEEEFKELSEYVMSRHITWLRSTFVSHIEEQDQKEFIENLDHQYFTNIGYTRHEQKSHLYEKCAPLLIRLQYIDHCKDPFRPHFRALIRLKANLIPHTHEMMEHASHYDYEYEHKSAVFGINTCDGFTRLGTGKDSITIPSVANRLLIFNGWELHNSSTTTDAKARVNLNLNYI